MDGWRVGRVDGWGGGVAGWGGGVGGGFAAGVPNRGKPKPD